MAEPPTEPTYRAATHGSSALAGDLTRILEGVLPVLAAAVAGSWLLLATMHLGDRAFVYWGDGVRMALARAATNGVLYPPLFDGTHFGGTRLMPIPILIHAGVASITGEFLTSGKLLTHLSFFVLVGVTYRAMRSLGCSAGRSWAVIAAVTAANLGAQTSLGISYDPLPVALQLMALDLVARQGSRQNVVTASVLCAAAFLAKFSAVWGCAAIAIWLWRRDRRMWSVFLGAVSVTVAAGLLAVHLTSGGRFAENLLALATAGADAGSAVPQLLAHVERVLPHAPVTFVLIPIGCFGALTAARAGRLTLYHVALLLSIAIVLVAFLDRGATYNHLLDATVLAAIATAGLWATRRDARERGLAIVIAVLFALLASFPIGLGEPALDALEQAVRGTASAELDPRPLEGLVRADDRILSEDPSIPVLLGTDPIVLDPFMLIPIGERHPGWIRALIARIEVREFDRIVLEFRLDEAPRGWYSEQHFGAGVVGAIRRNYVLIGERAGFAVYAPAAPGPTEAQR